MYHNNRTYQSSPHERKRKKFTKKKPRSFHKKKHSNSCSHKDYKIKIKHGHLNHANATSGYIGNERLTKRVGFLTKGKISDSIYRIEKIMPDELKARTQQDLHKVLQMANNLEVTSQTNISLYKDSGRRQKIYSSSESSSPHSPPFKSKKNCWPIPFDHSMNKYLNSNALSLDRHLDAMVYPVAKHSAYSITKHSDQIPSIDRNSVFASVRLQTPESTSNAETTELMIVEDSVRKLHLSIKCMNNELFNGRSNQESLKRELLSFKKQYDNTRNISASSNCESSQDCQRNHVSQDNFVLDPVMENTLRENYKFEGSNGKIFNLNPILSKESNAPRHLKNMFPEAQDMSSTSDSSSEEKCDIIDLTLPENHNIIGNYNTLKSFSQDNSFTSSSELESNSHPFQSSPTSISDSPVWKFNISPVKFIPSYVPSPKLYYRQKMF